MEIKNANESDVEKIYYILNKAREKLNKIGIRQWEEGWNIHALKQKCKLGCFYILYNNENSIGCYCIERNPSIEWIKDKEFSYLSSVCLLPEYQGKGLGKKLLKSAIQNSKTVIYLDCWSGNEKLKKFYIDNGFNYIKDVQEYTYYISTFKKEK